MRTLCREGIFDEASLIDTLFDLRVKLVRLVNDLASVAQEIFFLELSRWSGWKSYYDNYLE